jgi:peroxiredoxin
MKKIALFFFVTLFAISCKNSTFTIAGSVDQKELNGKTVFIKVRINRDWKTLDSTVIQDQKFAFKGISDTAKIAYVVYEFPAKKKVHQAFVLEGGNITVSVDTTNFMTIKGTAQNDLLQTYQNDKNTFNIKAETFYKTHKDSVKTPEQKVAFDKEMDKLNQDEVSIDKKFATEHVNTLVGTHVFTNSFYGYSLAEKEAIVALMNSETKKVKRIEEIIGDMEVEKKVAVGQMFTDIKLPTVAGDSLALSSLVGKTDFVMIDFWASWCGPCMQFLPDLQAFYSKNKGTKLQIFGVSLDDSKEALTGAVTAHKIEWKLVSDLKGWKCAGSRAYAVNSIPATVLIDKSGKIVGKNLSISEMEKLLNGKTDKK